MLTHAVTFAVVALVCCCYYGQSFVASGNIQYFQCTIKGCNVGQPVALTLASTTAVPTGYTGIIPVVIPQPQKTVREPAAVCNCTCRVGLFAWRARVGVVVPHCSGCGEVVCAARAAGWDCSPMPLGRWC